MIPQQSVTYDGTEYLLLYRKTGPVAKSWRWVASGSYDPVALSDIERLRDLFLAQDPSSLGPSATPRELKRLYEILLAMGGPKELILRRLGSHEPRSCVDCGQLTTCGYAGPRCEHCHEQFVRTARVRNAGNKEVQGGRMGGSQRR